MADAGGIRAGRAFVELGAKDSGLVKGLRAAEARVRAFGSAVAGVGDRMATLGTKLTRPLFEAAKTFADAGSELNDMSVRTGVSVEALSALGHAAGQTGASLENVEGALRFMARAITAGAMGSKQVRKQFAALGIDLRELVGLKPEVQFERIARSLRQIPDPTERAGMAMKILGKSATSILPMIDEMDELTKEAKELGLVMSTEDAKAADALGDKMDSVRAVLGRVVQLVGSALSPVLIEVADQILSVSRRVLDWIKDNKPLVATIFKVGAAIAAAGGFLIAFGPAMAAFAGIIGALATAFSVVLSPVGLLAAAIGIVASRSVNLKSTFADIIGSIRSGFTGLLDTATRSFGGIVKALKGGDFAAAGRIAVAALNLEWAKFSDFLGGLWETIKVEGMIAWEAVGFAIMGVWVDVWAQIRGGWTRLILFLEGAWAEMVAAMAEAVRPIARALDQVFGAGLEGDIDRAVAAGDQAAAATRGRVQQNRLAGVEAGRVKGHADLDAAQQASAAARRAGGPGARVESPAVRKARKELADALAAVEGKGADEKKRRVKSVAQTFAGGPGEGGPRFEIERAQRTVDVKGTFSAAALRGMSAGDTLADFLGDKIKENTKEVKKNGDKLDEIADNTENGLQFEA